MADVVKGTVVNKKGSGASSDSVSVTCNGTNRLLLVFFALVDAANPADMNITAITYAGAALTRYQGRQFAGNDGETEVWYLVNPASGANTLSWTFQGATDDHICVAIPLQNVNQTSPMNTGNGSAGTGTSRSVSVTTTVDRCQLYSLLALSAAATNVAVGSGQTAISSQTQGNVEEMAGEKDAVVTPAGAASMNFTWTGSVVNSEEVVAIDSEGTTASPPALALNANENAPTVLHEAGASAKSLALTFPAPTLVEILVALPPALAKTLTFPAPSFYSRPIDIMTARMPPRNMRARSPETDMTAKTPPRRMRARSPDG